MALFLNFFGILFDRSENPQCTVLLLSICFLISASIFSLLLWCCVSLSLNAVRQPTLPRMWFVTFDKLMYLLISLLSYSMLCWLLLAMQPPISVFEYSQPSFLFVIKIWSSIEKFMDFLSLPSTNFSPWMKYLRWLILSRLM